MKKIIKISLALIITSLLLSCNKAQNEVKENTIPKSIVSLSPAATEILYAIGASDQIAAVSQFSNYPSEAATKPVVGGFDGNTLSLETILSFEPDLVYLTEGMHNFLIPGLEENKISYFVSNATTLQAVYDEILEVGKITAHESEANEVVQKMQEDFEKGYYSKGEYKVYYEVWNAPYMSIGSTSFMNDILKYSGGVNIFEDLSDAYPVVSEEEIIARNPDVIILPSENGLTKEDIKARKGWENINAVKNNFIYFIDSDLYSRPGPRIIDAILQLRSLLFV